MKTTKFSANRESLINNIQKKERKFLCAPQQTAKKRQISKGLPIEKLADKLVN